MPSRQFRPPLAAAALMLACAPTIALGEADDPGAARAGQAVGQVIDDSVITAKVKAAHLQDPLVNALDVHVETAKGVVWLSGFVPSEAAKERAAALAQGVEGVKEVKNGIQVTK